MTALTVQDIKKQIINLPNRPPAMLASKVAEVYGVDSKRVNEAVRRNPDRFPEDFCFRLTPDEVAILGPQNAALRAAPSGHLPRMFTRFGANMLSAVLKSPIAAERSVQIMRAFSLIEEGVVPKIPKDKLLVSKQEYIDLHESTVVKLDDYMELMEENRELQRELAHLLREKAAPKKKRRAVKPITDDEIEEAIRLKGEGLSNAEIARRLGRSPGTVSWIVRDMGVK